MRHAFSKRITKESKNLLKHTVLNRTQNPNGKISHHSNILHIHINLTPPDRRSSEALHMSSTLCVREVTNHCEFPSWSRKDLDLRADSWASGSEWVSWWDLRHPREQKAGDTRGTCRARAQSVTTEVPTVVECFSQCSQQKGFSWVWVLW